MQFTMEIIVSIFLVFGAFFMLVGSIGMVRLPDLFMRLHAPTKSSTLGLGSFLIASMIFFAFQGRFGFAELLITLLAFITAPVSANLIAQAALHLRLRSLSGEVPEAIQKLLPRLQNPEETEVLMVTLPETTPVYESMRLADDLDRANIAHTWWLVNQSMVATHTNNAVLKAIASNEIKWIEKVAKLSDNKYAVEKWQPNFEK